MTDDGVTINTTIIPSDAQNYALLALAEAAVYGSAVAWVECHCFVTEACCATTSLQGVDFNDDCDGI
jgi:hypothetical protein